MNPLPQVDPEFRGLIPPLAAEEREQLEQNILESRKCHDPIVLWEGVILDGHNRFEICVWHGIEFQIVEVALASRDEAIVWILDNQLSRRNLSDVARMEMAVLKMDMLREKAKMNLSLAGGDKKSKKSPLTKVSKPEIDTVNVKETTAAEAGVGAGTLQRYMQIKDQGSPELLEKVQSGEMRIGTAHRLLPKEIMKQLSLADKMIKFIKNAAPPEGYKAADPEIHGKLTDLAALMSAVLGKLGGDHEAA